MFIYLFVLEIRSLEDDLKECSTVFCVFLRMPCLLLWLINDFWIAILRQFLFEIYFKLLVEQDENNVIFYMGFRYQGTPACVRM